MYLLDQIAQSRNPFIVVNDRTGERTHLHGAAEAAADIRECPIRYVLSDDLTTLCTDLAYSKGARVFGCMDLLRIPAASLWVEWSHHPWAMRMTDYGFDIQRNQPSDGRFGVLIQALNEGRSGVMRSFWSFSQQQTEVFASAVVSRFRLDGPLHDCAPGRAPQIRVRDADTDPDNILSQSFQFSFEESWARYYEHATANSELRSEALRVATGTVAPAVPFLLAFLLLLLSRDRLPHQRSQLDRLNAARSRSGKHPLLDHIEVHAPLFSSPPGVSGAERRAHWRRTPRLHHVRGHLVRRADQLFWRVPHLRGSARRGTIKSRTVTWTVDPAPLHIHGEPRVTPLEITNTRPE